MANETVNQLPEQTLQPKEYVQWLLSLEQAYGLPDGIRAYLVSMDPENGTRRLSPVERGASVISLKTDLKSHLSASILGLDFYEDLRAFCDEKLRPSGRIPLASDRAELALQASWEIAGSAELVHAQLDTSADNLPLRSLLRRIKLLAGLQMDAIGDEQQTLQEIQERLEA